MGSALEDILEPQNCVLIVIDMQNRFCHPQEKFAKDGKDITPMQSVSTHIKKLIDFAHSKNIPVIFTRIFDNENKLTEPGKRRYRKWVEAGEEPLVGPKENTFGADYYEVNPEPQDLEITKYDWSAFTGKDKNGKSLEEILRDIGRNTLVVTGVKTEVCVGTTIRDAYTRGYFVVVPKEAVGSDSKDLHEANLKNFDPIYGDVVEEKEIEEIWQQPT